MREISRNTNVNVIAIVAYKPRPGKEAALLALARTHVPRLRAEGLATEREPLICRAADGTVLEVFEWVAGGTDRAHSNPRVLAMWAEYAEVCEYVPLNTLPECAQMFATFTAVED
jgi:hypothetical protein